MSSVMSSDLESSNPFDRLFDDPILHIFSYLPGADLLHLSEIDQKFKRIITESTETMSKIRLVLEFNNKNDLDLDYAIKLARSRRFTSLRLKLVSKLTDAKDKVKLVSLLELLSGSVDDLIIEGNFSKKDFYVLKIPHDREPLSSILALLLPRLKKCKLIYVLFDAPIIKKISSLSSVNHPLESLELIGTHATQVLHLFAGCNHLKTFCYIMGLNQTFISDINIEHVNNFLAKQDHLEKLVHSCRLAWNRLRCFKLKELRAFCLATTDDQLAAAKFLRKLTNLTHLHFGFYKRYKRIIDHPSRRLMKAISRIPKLEKLELKSMKVLFLDEDEDEVEDNYEGLVNHTVKKLEIIWYTNITAKLLKVFLGAESVHINGYNNWDKCTQLDLSDIPPETIAKIKPSKDHQEILVVKFSPIDTPTNVEPFQSAVMTFAETFSEFIEGIEIGHASWRHSEAFRVSNSFCERLVNQLPKLGNLEVYNIAERGRFVAFLDENQARLSLEDVKLHNPFKAGELEPKKLNIQID